MTERRGPAAAHWRAVNLALCKFCSLERYALIGAGYRLPESFRGFSWDDANLPSDKAACMATFADGSTRVYLRSDLPPDEVHENVLHELQHVLDAPYVRAGASRDWLEARARWTSARLAALP